MTSRKASATRKLNEKTSFKMKKEFPWRSYDEGYDLRISELVIVAKKKRLSFKVTKDRLTSKVIAIRKLLDSSKNTSLSMLL